MRCGVLWCGFNGCKKVGVFIFVLVVILCWVLVLGDECLGEG